METDELIASTMRRVATSAQPGSVDHIMVRAARQRRARLYAAAAAGVAAVTVATTAAVGGLHLGSANQQPDVVPPASQPMSEPTAPVEDLTGKAVGEALGLTPITTGVVRGCDYFAEYADGKGYCLDPVDLPKVDIYLLMHQISGRSRTPTSIAYAEAILELHQLTNVGDHTDNQQVRDLVARIVDLEQELKAEQGP